VGEFSVANGVFLQRGCLGWRLFTSEYLLHDDATAGVGVFGRELPIGFENFLNKCQILTF